MVDIEELKAIVREPQVMPFAADHAVVKLLHIMPNVIAELESLREQVAKKPDARRLAEEIVEYLMEDEQISQNTNDARRTCNEITSIIEREMGK
jgi:DNA-directed RNA polymerase subunit F